MNISEYKEYFNSFSPYFTYQEKNASIEALNKENSAISILKTLGMESKTEFEAIAIIFKLREISVSDFIELNHTCGECNYQDILQVSIPKMFFKDEVEDTFNNIGIPIGLFDEISDINTDINTLSIPEYDKLENIIFSNNIKIFDPKVNITCRKCGNSFNTTISFRNIISKAGIKNIFEQYIDISTYTNMTKNDTDKMYPYERELFLGIIQEREDKKE